MRIVFLSEKHGMALKHLANSLSKTIGSRVVLSRRVLGTKNVIFHRGTDKLTQLQSFKNFGISCPDFTSNIEVAKTWIKEGFIVICRTMLRASEGKGIVVARQASELVSAGLYTKYVRKNAEYRIHVFHSRVIDIQQKRLRLNFKGERNNLIRNWDNGFVFCRQGLVEPNGIRDLALKAINVLKYNIGAVDIIQDKQGKLLVLEVNALPGMEGSTLESYAKAILEWRNS